MLSPSVKQTWAVMGVLLNMFGQGMVLSFPSVLLPAILSPDSEIKGDLHVASWLASCVGFSSMPGFVASSVLMGWYGRKVSQVLVVLPGCIGWILISVASNIPVLIVGRIFCGFTAGASVTLGAVVIGEFTSPRNRGMFLNLKTTAVCLGNAAVHIFGHFWHWKYVALTALIPHIAALLIIFTWPESPSWLASKKKFSLCEKSFFWLRGTDEESRRELQEIIRIQKEKSEQPQLNCKTKNVTYFFNRFSRREFMKPVLIMFCGGILLEACGRHIIPAFATQIIEEITGNKSLSFYYTLGIDIIISASAMFSSFLVKIMKRRTLLFNSGFAAIFILACVCLYLYLSANQIISRDRTWVPITLFCLFFILSNLGCTPIPLAFVGEIFPLAYKGAGSIVSGLILSFFLMVGMQITPYLLVSINVHGTFTVLGLVMGLSLGVLCFILPETKDRTLQEIEDYFNFGRFRDNKIDDDETKIKNDSLLK